MPKILVKKRSEIITEYKLGNKTAVNVGTAKGNDIVLSDKNISERHCIISRKGDSFEIKDKNTLSGTQVNGRAIVESELKFSDVICVGPYTLVLRPDKSRGAVQTAEEAQSTEKRYHLLGVYGKFEGKKYEILQGQTYIGRENISPKGIDNDIVLAGDMTASKGHARIDCSSNQCSVTDIGSTGGIAVNGNKVGQLNEIPLKPGDEVAIGRSIFRFVSENAEDYSYPRNHKILLLKLRRPVTLLLLVGLITAGGWLMFNGIRGISVIKSKPAKLDINISRFWSPDGNVVRMSAPDYDITSSPAIGDINNDKLNEIVYLNSAGQLCAWNGKTGAQVWKPVEVFNSGKSSPVLYDMNNDGILDIVVISDTSMLYIIDGQTGGIIRREMLGGVVSELSPVVADLNGDGKPDVVACSEEGMAHFIYSPGFNEIEKYTEFMEARIAASPAIISTEKIAPLVVIASIDGKVSFFDGKNRNKKTVDVVEKTNGKAHFINATPAIGDINGDGTPEVIVQTNVPQYVTAVDIKKFDVIWTYFVEPVPPEGLKHTASPVVTDANGDGIGDVIALSANGYAYALKGNTGYPAGELLWKVQVPSPNKIISAPAVLDFEKNGIQNIVFGSEDGTMYILKNSPSRKEMEIMSSFKASNAPITSSIAAADINGDGLIELVCSNTLNTLQVLTTNMRTFNNYISWPMYLGNAMHSGASDEKYRLSHFYLLAIGGIILLIVVIAGKIIAKIDKLNKRPKVVYL